MINAAARSYLRDMEELEELDFLTFHYRDGLLKIVNESKCADVEDMYE